MNTHYNDFQNCLAVCISEGCYTFEQCSRGDQEDMTRHYWLSLDAKQRLGFLSYIEETLQEVAFGNGGFNQADLEEALIEFYGKEINGYFSAERVAA